jgi:hypothetical protein
MRRRTHTAVVAAFTMVVLGGVAYTVNVARTNGIPAAARDLDCDGEVSLVEWYSAGLNYGWRRATDGSSGCMEVFALKDGLPVVCVCEHEPRCRRAH